MNTQTPARVARRQRARAADDYVADLGRRLAVLDRTPDDWPEDAGTYPPRAVRRARKPRHRASGVVSLHQNRSDSPPSKLARARRVRAARRAARCARRMGWSA